jgi:hypothetical protein
MCPPMLYSMVLASIHYGMRPPESRVASLYHHENITTVSQKPYFFYYKNRPTTIKGKLKEKEKDVETSCTVVV